MYTENMISRVLIGIFALAGLGIMSYLTYTHFANAQSFCDFTTEVSCDVVTTSIYSELFGIPMSILGMGYFTLILLLAAFYKKDSFFRAALFITIFVLVPSFYLTLMEVIVIDSFCVLCETSKVLMLLIAGLSLAHVIKKKIFSFRDIAPILIAGILVSGITYFAQQGGGTKKDYSELISCLNEKGVVYYKSVRCSNCRRQEKLLGIAYPKLNAVECHPDGEDPRPQLCLEKNVTKTPTFILERDGIEVKRAEGIQQVNELAKFADCPFAY